MLSSGYRVESDATGQKGQHTNWKQSRTLLDHGCSGTRGRGDVLSGGDSAGLCHIMEMTAHKIEKTYSLEVTGHIGLNHGDCTKNRDDVLLVG